MKLVNSILLLLLLVNMLQSIELRKVGEYALENNVDIYCYNNNLVTFNQNPMKIVFYVGKKVARTIPFNEGDGPSDFRIINNIIFNNGNIICWDRMSGHIKRFSNNMKLLNCEKMPLKYSRFALLLNSDSGKHIFLSSNMNRKKTKVNVIQKLSIFDINKKKSNIIKKVNGIYIKNGSLDYNNPILLAATSQDGIYYTNSFDGDLYYYDRKIGKSELIDKWKNKSIQWNNKYYELRYKIMNKTSDKIKVIMPEKLPNIFAMVSSKNILCVITNEKIDQNLTVLRIYKNKIYQGKVSIPLTTNQHFVFNDPIFRFNPGIAVGNNYIFALELDKNNEGDSKIVKWKIIF